MIDLLTTFLTQYGPVWGPALFTIILVVAVFFTRIERRVFLHSQRENFAFLDKKLFTYDELVKYRLIDDSMPSLELFR